MSTKIELTAKQKRFCDEYLIDLNATQAAIRSGYSQKTAKEIGYEHLTKPHIREYIEEKQKRLEIKTEISQEWVVNNLKYIAERCMQADAVRDKEGNATGEWTFQHSGANKALELIGRHLGMFNDKLDIGGVESLKAQIEEDKKLAQRCLLKK
jgi:phage terminase small subunit